jgi:hypothetical protein
MGWLRVHLQKISCVALIALALQMALSFTHIHVSGFVTSNKATVTAAKTISPSGLPDAPAKPSKPHPVGLADFCALCAVSHLAGAALPVASPVLPLLLTSGPAWVKLGNYFALTATTHASFQARAPPIA